MTRANIRRVNLTFFYACNTRREREQLIRRCALSRGRKNFFRPSKRELASLSSSATAALQLLQHRGRAATAAASPLKQRSLSFSLPTKSFTLLVGFSWFLFSFTQPLLPFSVQRARTEFSGCTNSAILDLKTNSRDEKNRERPGTQGKLVESCTGCNKTTLDNASKYRVTPVRPTFRSSGAFFFNDLPLLSDGSLPSLYRVERTRYLYQRFEAVSHLRSRAVG